MRNVLVLGGTALARQFAKTLLEERPGTAVTLSFAGVVSDLPRVSVPTRIGGFGGPDSLAAYLAENSVTDLVDASHPFAETISRNASDAARITGLPCYRLERPPWPNHPDDNWQRAATLAEAARLIPQRARVLLAIGRKEIGVFRGRTDLKAVARMIEPPADALPSGWELVLDRPSADPDEESRFLQAHGIKVMVSKNSGGDRPYAKIVAARQLGLPVIMVDRPLLPDGPQFSTVGELLQVFRTA